MARGWGLTIVVMVLLIGASIAIIVSDEVPCSSFPSCPLSADGFWAAVAFIALALVAGAIRAVAGPGRPKEPPPND